MITALLAAGADMDGTRRLDPLMGAHPEVITALLAAGANAKTKKQ